MLEKARNQHRCVCRHRWSFGSCWCRMLKLRPQSHNKILEESDNMVSPSNQCVKSIRKKHPNKVKQDTKKDKIPYKSHD